MDTLKLGLGSIIETEQSRDCLHIAVAPVIAHERLIPGDHVGLNEAGEATEGAPHIGVVDPFLKVKSVKAGERFWLFLFPGTITGLRHEWSHPAFTKAAIAGISESEQWIRDFADKHLERYDDLMDAAESFQRTGEYLCRGSKFEGEYVPEEFWEHYEKVTGKKPKDTGNFFTCSC